MPGGLEAALVVVVLVVPGYLALAGYRLGRASSPTREGVFGVAKAITVSAFFVLVVWRLGGQAVYENARAGTALADDEALTYRLAVAGLVIPPLIGFVFGEATDWVAGRVGQVREDDTAPEDGGKATRLKLWTLSRIQTRLPLDGPTTWDRVWKDLRRSEPYVYVRVVTVDGQVVMGTVGRRSRAAVSPQPRDLYVEEVLRPVKNPTGDIEFAPTREGRGMFLAGEHIAVVEWIGHKGLKEIPSDGRQAGTSAKS